MTQTFILPEEMSEWSFSQLTSGASIGLVPTMGALHDGHLQLVKEMKTAVDKTVVSIFVNPKQFGPNEDYAKYPRTIKSDIAKLQEAGVDVAFVPNAAQIYGDAFETYVTNDEMSAVLCGASRPGHFRGVLTVVLKLFNITLAHKAFFGKKDYQQFRMIERMRDDLSVPIEIVGVDTIREPTGLAMSSRNEYLSPEERQQASSIYKGLVAARGFYQAGERQCEKLLEVARSTMSEIPGLEIEYLEICDQHTLHGCAETVDKPPVMLVAARLGSVRLIDNLELDAGV